MLDARHQKTRKSYSRTQLFDAVNEMDLMSAYEARYGAYEKTNSTQLDSFIAEQVVTHSNVLKEIGRMTPRGNAIINEAFRRDHQASPVSMKKIDDGGIFNKREFHGIFIFSIPPDYPTTPGIVHDKYRNITDHYGKNVILLFYKDGQPLIREFDDEKKAKEWFMDPSVREELVPYVIRGQESDADGVLEDIDFEMVSDGERKNPELAIRKNLFFRLEHEGDTLIRSDAEVRTEMAFEDLESITQILVVPAMFTGPVFPVLSTLTFAAAMGVPFVHHIWQIGWGDTEAEHRAGRLGIGMDAVNLASMVLVGSIMKISETSAVLKNENTLSIKWENAEFLPGFEEPEVNNAINQAVAKGTLNTPSTVQIGSEQYQAISLGQSKVNGAPTSLYYLRSLDETGQPESNWFGVRFKSELPNELLGNEALNPKEIEPIIHTTAEPVDTIKFPERHEAQSN